MDQYRTFPTLQDARDYRHANGTGGWIFAPEPIEGAHFTLNESIIFPPQFTPSQIFAHPYTVGRSGKLVGN